MPKTRDVTFNTEASKLVSKKRHISHWSAVSELDSFCQKHVIYDVRSFIRLKTTWLLQYLGKERSCSTWLGRGMGQMFYCFQKISHIRWCIIHVSIGPISLRVLYKMKVGSHPYCHLCNTSTVGSYLHVLGISSGGSFLEICMFCSFGFPAFR